jgi:hypothetical protein
MTAQMREQAQAGAKALAMTHVDVRDGDATQLPVDDGSVDVVISNGVLNLVPLKDRAIADVGISHRFDCFAGTTKERTARRYRVGGVNLSAIRTIR